MRYCRIAIAGLVGTLSALSQASAQSFDCKVDRGRTEQAICGDAQLREMDQRMANLYFSIQADNTGRRHRRLKHDQGEWLKERNDCGANVRCLRRAYAERIRELEDALGD